MLYIYIYLLFLGCKQAHLWCQISFLSSCCISFGLSLWHVKNNLHRFLLEMCDFSLKGLNQILGLVLPALSTFLLGYEEASQISTRASAAFFQLPHPCIMSLHLQAVLLFHLRHLRKDSRVGRLCTSQK